MTLPKTDALVPRPDAVQAKLDSFDARAEGIITAFVAPIDAATPPAMIYHYTNESGLRGILDGGKIWLTDMFSLNDKSELNHGFLHIVKILNDMAVAEPPETKLFAKQMEAFSAQGGIQAVAHYFVASLSAAGDELGQWIAYAATVAGTRWLSTLRF